MKRIDNLSVYVLILVFFGCLLPQRSMAYDVEVDGIYYNLDQNNLTAAVTKGTTYYSGDVIIPSSVEYQGTAYKVTSIEELAFYYSEQLTAVSLPEGLTSIGMSSFGFCRALTSVIIPNSVTEIGDWAFYWCTKLSSVSMGNGVEEIKDYTFRDCWSLPSIEIGNNVKKIGYDVFENCKSLTSIVLPDGLTEIGAKAFAECGSLVSINLPQGVDRIEAETFLKCSSLASVDIPIGVGTICKGAFNGCSSLTSVFIPRNVTSIEYEAFAYCPAITDISVDEDNAIYDSRDNCNAIIETATGTLLVGCKNTVIPESVTSIGDLSFEGCSSLTKMVIPDWVTSVGHYAFQDCQNLETLVIGNSVTEIGVRAFLFCPNLKEVFLRIENPFGLSSNTFSYEAYQNAILYVPIGTIEAYQAAWGWQEFEHIVEYNVDAIRVIPSEAPTDGTCYGISGQRRKMIQRGINIFRQSDSTARKIWMR